MKYFIFIVSLGVAFATDFNMKIKEEGKQFVEKIKVDAGEQTEEIVVPAHLDRAAVDVLKDFNVGLSAMKRVDLKKCFIETINNDDESPTKMEASMRLSMAKFPAQKFMVINKKSIEIGELSEAEVGKKIAAHCTGYKLIKIISFVQKNINVAVLNILKAIKKAGRSKRDAQFSQFVACRNDSTKILSSCPVAKLAASCRFWRNDKRTCTYTITCRMGDMGVNCVGAHTFSTLHCCDFICRHS